MLGKGKKKLKDWKLLRSNPLLINLDELPLSTCHLPSSFRERRRVRNNSGR
jgi:hypothetical protein